MDQTPINRFLVFCSTRQGLCAADLFNSTREFDIAIHNYDDQPIELVKGEYYVHAPHREKLETAATLLPSLPAYSQYAFLDDDLNLSTSDINRLFHIGESLRLPLYQPSLSPKSFISHKHLRQQSALDNGGKPVDPVRWAPFVEIQCPFFSHDALFTCLWTFGLNCSGWGLDCFFWPGMVARQTYVIDSIAAGHHRPIGGGASRLLHNGLTAQQELWIAERIHP